jgi:hypothetical protein
MKAPRNPRISRPFLLGAGSRAGVAAVEFAIVAPVLIAMVIAATELGFAIRDSLRAQAAAAAGAYYAIKTGFDAPGISAAVANGATGGAITASPAPSLSCGCPSAAGIAPATCGATCLDGMPARQYVRVSASIARTSVLPSDLGLPDTLTRQTVVRLP